MRVLYFHQHFTTPTGSTGTRSYEFARRLVAASHQVTIVCGSYRVGKTGLTGPPVHGRREGNVDGIDVVEFVLPYSNRDPFARRAATFVRFAMASAGIALIREADVIVATSTPLTAGIPGIAAKALRRRPFVFEVRDLWPELPRAMGVIRNRAMLGALTMLEWSSYHAADELIGLAPGIVQGIVRRGIPEERVHLIPNGCDLDLFHPAKRDPASLAGFRSDDFVALFSGAHGIANGLDAVLDAAAVLRDRGRTDIKILFVGDGKLKPALMERAAREDLHNCVFWDPISKLRIATVTASVGAGLQILQNVPAFYEGTSPNKFFDYIAAGIPVINNYPGWLADLIRRHDCGIAVPPNDAVAFADALVALADDRAHAAAMGSRGRLLAEQAFARDALAARFTDVLMHAATRRG